jgi:hypothetical protein
VRPPTTAMRAVSQVSASLLFDRIYVFSNSGYEIRTVQGRDHEVHNIPVAPVSLTGACGALSLLLFPGASLVVV